MEQKNAVYKYLNACLKRKYLAISLFIAVSAGVVCYSFLAPRSYEAKTLVRVQRDRIVNPLGKGIVDSEQAGKRLATLKQTITSRYFIEPAVKKTGLDSRAKNRVEFDSLLENTAKKVDVSLKGRADLFEIKFHDPKPKLAALFVNTLSGEYTEYILNSKKGQAYTALEFLEEQVDAYRRKLEGSEQALRGFKEEHLDQLPEVKGNNLSKLEALKNALATTDLELREALSRKGILVRKMGNARGGSTTNRGHLIRVKKAELKELLSRYTEIHPGVVKLKRDIEELESGKPYYESGGAAASNGSGAFFDSVSRELDNTNLEIGTLRNRKKELEREIGVYEQKVRTLPAIEQQLIKLTRDYNVNDEIYQTLLTRLEETKIARELEKAEVIGIFEVLDPAIVPVRATKPDRPKLILLGILLGVGVGLGFAFLMEYWDSSLNTMAEAKEYFRNLGLGVSSVIPKITTPEERKRESMRNASIIAVGVVYTLSVLGVFVVEYMKAY